MTATLLILLAALGPRQQQLQAVVWVNTATHTYHCAGSRFYGTTVQGEYMSEAAARGTGNHANSGTGCPPGPAVAPKPRYKTHVWINTQSGKYFCPGAALYARTERGRFLSESAARSAGFTPALGKRCR